MSTFLLTGGLGFIGYHLAKRLILDKHSVVILDAMKHYIPAEASNWPYYSIYRENALSQAAAEAGVPVTIIKGDCNDTAIVADIVRENSPDMVIHLAALSIAGICSESPVEAKTNILDSTVSVLETLKGLKFPVERFIYFSSSMVYGNFLRNNSGEIIPATEDQKCDPIDIYGTLKLCCENLVKAYHFKYGLPYTIIRPSAVYGHTDCNRRVTEIFIKNALLGESLLLDNKGTHQLDFTCIDDLVDGITASIYSKNSLDGTFNISGGKGWAINELAETICKLVPGTIIKRVEAVPFRPNRGAQNISRARETFGFEPKYHLEKGIDKYIRMFREDLKQLQMKNI